MITKLKDFICKLIKEKFNLINKFDILNQSPEDIIKYVGNDTSGFNYREDAIKELKYLINTDFPSGFKNIPDVVILYRVLLLKDGDSINEDVIGEHFISDPRLIDIYFLRSIGVWHDWSENAELWLLTCETEKNNIDIERTIGNRLLYPRENEFTLYNDKKIKIINKKRINKNSII